MPNSVGSFALSQANTLVAPSIAQSTAQSTKCGDGANNSSPTEYNHQKAQNYISACTYITNKTIYLEKDGTINSAFQHPLPECTELHRNYHCAALDAFEEEVAREAGKEAKPEEEKTLLTVCKTIAGKYQMNKNYQYSVEESGPSCSGTSVVVTVGDSMHKLGNNMLVRLPDWNDLAKMISRKSTASNTGVNSQGNEQEHSQPK
jgi:hypothetical protein